MGPTFWLHVNHSNDKAILHRDDGCAWVRKAADRKRRNLPYGEVLGDRNGAWEAFSTRAEAEVAQRATGKREQRPCALCFGR